MNVAWNLSEQLERIGERLSPERRAVMERRARELLDSNIAIRSLAGGDRVEDFELPNAVGRRVRLSDLLERGPVVVSFYRGSWCPYCSLELNALQESLRDIEDAGASLVTISPQTPDKSLSTAEKLRLAFEVLSDVGNVVARRFGIVFRLPEEFRAAYRRLGIDLPAYNGDDSFELPVPATYVIGPDAVIRLAFVNPDYTVRLPPAQIVAALRRMRDSDLS